MKKLALLVLPVFMAIASCSTPLKGYKSAQVSFTDGKNYFSVDDINAEKLLVITTQEEFEKHFNPAATMGKDGEPTQIDFNKSFVIGKILPVTNRPTDIKPLRLEVKDGKTLVLTSKKKVGKETNYSMRPTYFIIVNKQYADYKIEEVIK